MKFPDLGEEKVFKRVMIALLVGASFALIWLLTTIISSVFLSYLNFLVVQGYVITLTMAAFVVSLFILLSIFFMPKKYWS